MSHPRIPEEEELTGRLPRDSVRIPEPGPGERTATLTVLKGPRVGAVFQLGTETSLGRSAEANIRLVMEGVSRLHARIRERDGVYFLEDLGSTNGTVWRGTLIEEIVELSDGDRISLGGRVILRFAVEGHLEQELREQLYELATRDPLTTAYNRRYLEERMDSEWPWAVRHELACAYLLVDVDHFKRVNDTWGHLAGDDVLAQVVRILYATIRREDVLARVGGEEFAVLCRATSLASGAVLAERIRCAIEQHDFLWRGEAIEVTVSVGVCASDEPGVSHPEQLRELADRRLYEAKARGRNRVEPAPTE